MFKNHLARCTALSEGHSGWRDRTFSRLGPNAAKNAADHKAPHSKGLPVTVGLRILQTIPRSSKCILFPGNIALCSLSSSTQLAWRSCELLS